MRAEFIQPGEGVGKAGAPLIEPIAGDQENMAVTFLWKGRPDTRNVLVLWLPYAGAAPDEFQMARMGDTDVWYKTIKVDRRMRLAYALAPNTARLRPLSLGIDADAITMIAAQGRIRPELVADHGGTTFRRRIGVPSTMLNWVNL